MDLENIKPGMVVKNYKEMCRLLGEEEKEGSSRTAQIEEWKRFIEFEKEERKHPYTITKVYDDPKPKPIRANDKYTKSILNVLVYDITNNSETDNTRMKSYSRNDLLVLFGMVEESWRHTKRRRAAEAEFEAFAEAFRSARGAKPTKKMTRFLFNDLYKKVDSHAWDKISRSLKRLSKKGYLYLDESRWETEDGKYESRELKPWEEERYEELRASTQEELGVRYTNFYNKDAFYEALDEKCRAELGLTYIKRLYEIHLPYDFEPVGREEYESALRHINGTFVETLLEYFEEVDENKALKDYNKALESNEDIQELIELGIEYDVHDVIPTYGGTEIKVDMRKALVDWFIRPGGKEEILQSGFHRVKAVNKRIEEDSDWIAEVPFD